MFENSDEQQLISLLRQGQQAAFRRLFDLHYKMVLKTSTHLLKNQTEAEDVCQEIFASLWNNRERLPKTLYLSAYLKKAAINKSINALKTRKSFVHDSDRQLMELKSSQTPAQKLEHQELTQLIHDAIDGLPLRCRSIYILKRVEGLSHQEVADQLGISKKTIENQMTKALRLLKDVVLKYKKDIDVNFLLLGWGMMMLNWLLG